MSQTRLEQLAQEKALPSSLDMLRSAASMSIISVSGMVLVAAGGSRRRREEQSSQQGMVVGIGAGLGVLDCGSGLDLGCPPPLKKVCREVWAISFWCISLVVADVIDPARERVARVRVGKRMR